MTLRSLLFAAPVATFLLLPDLASAHLVTSGLGPVYDGIYHFLFSPDEILLVLVLALFAGLRGPAHARLLIAALAIGWLTGAGIVGLSVSVTLQSIVTAASLLAIGGALAADLWVPRWLLGVAALACGMWHGSLDAASFAIDSAPLPPVLGCAVSVFVLAALAASISLPLQKLWAITAVRVAGSWTAALGLLLAGWAVHAVR